MRAAVAARDAGGGIRLAGLAKTFQSPHGPVRAVAGIDLEVAAGETVALLGPNGAGKSTTIVPITGDGIFATVAKLLPSYWLVQASHVGLGGAARGRTGWLVVAAWTAGLTALAFRAYRRDTGRF